ncbi:signal peptidase II [Nocardioides sp. zg-1228]|uniref:signal peptidase II n=1 Tax=Nocardioides sp. zg-1228 TaxID=2763008 RepID=UPI001643465C|nr:signal peptidase II [Nocardioides sp. zg-1228]MBC2933545.1 signal peptidase II [Nocardioides sp. zg-1228]QSF56327.1 signal peptidase II [Nocardioides sp. zg-1228]
MQAARGASLNSSDPADQATARRRRVDARVLFAAVAITAYAVDLGTKEWALSALADGDIPVLGDWLTLHLTFNPGAAFSTGTDFTIVFTCLAIAAVVVVLWLSRRIATTGWALALGFLLGGVAGNLTDRILRDPEPFHGHVVDFLMLPKWPVFNIADVCINVAAGLIILQTFRGIALDGTRESDARSDAGSDARSDEAEARREPGREPGHGAT